MQKLKYVFKPTSNTENPRNIRLKIESNCDINYNEIFITCYENGKTVADLVIGLCPEKFDLRILSTLDAERIGEEFKLVLFPMRTDDQVQDW